MRGRWCWVELGAAVSVSAVLYSDNEPALHVDEGVAVSLVGASGRHIGGYDIHCVMSICRMVLVRNGLAVRSMRSHSSSN